MLAVAGVVYAARADDDGGGHVVRVIDGDTLVAMVAGEETTIRLLNIDTPETKDPNEEVQCLGPEATDFLTERLPEGTEIDLEYDEERIDPYGRTLAGVYESEELINAEIAAEGLGVPVLFEPNDRFLPEVEDASQDAQSDGRGLFSAEIDCSLPAQLQTLSGAAGQIPAAVDGDPADALAGATALIEEFDVFIGALDPTGLPGLGNAVMAGPRVADYMADLRIDAGDERKRAESARSTLEGLQTEYDEEQERLEAERLEREEKERLEREEKERLERVERERLEREEQERRERERENAQEEPAPAPANSGDAESGGSSSGTRDNSSSSDDSTSGSESSGSSRDSSSQSSGGGSSDSSSGESSSSGGSGGSSSEETSSSDSSGGPGSSSDSGCTPYGPEIPHSDAGGYTGLRYGMPGGETFRKCR
ncbi:MAG: thermonuclease family protein [Brachybacterium sp.]|uniref:thermonuclease family protein n=1 Tax=Brachybacterium sp. TaxID=1891286 RepID=UPI002649D25A|nr:thermonuclease family protein [Brachybacterium sp.]MDN5688158.1 thermonuclease family protein [Brachybacterium sp.]